MQPGDLVFFQNTVWAGISHVDIYVGGGKMIGADSVQTGVQWDMLSDAYWQQHYLGATRPLTGNAATEATPSATSVATTAPVAPTPTPTAVASTSIPTAVASTSIPISLASSPTPISAASSSTPASESGLALAAGMIVTTQYETALYSGPSDTDIVIGTVTPGMPLMVVWAHGPWVAVSNAGGEQDQSGWIPSTALAPQEAAAGAGSGSDASPQAGTNASTATPTPGSVAADRTAVSQGITPTLAIVQGTPAAVYDRPSPNGAVLTMFAAGTEVVALQTFGPWERVALPDGSEGWVVVDVMGPLAGGDTGSDTGGTQRRTTSPPSRDQEPAASDNTRAPHLASRAVIVTADALFVRAGPSRGAHILGQVFAGARLPVLATQQGWEEVRLRDGSRGWVSTQWVRAAHAG